MKESCWLVECVQNVFQKEIEMKYYKIFAFDSKTESGRKFEDRVQPFLDNNWQPLGISPAILLLQKEVVSEEQFEEMKESLGVEEV